MSDEGFSTPEPPQAWRASALCAQVDPELYFPTKSQSRQAAKAKQVCRGCESLEECLDYALRDPSLEGIWGATTRSERQAARREGTPMTLTKHVADYTSSEAYAAIRALVDEGSDLDALAYQLATLAWNAENRMRDIAEYERATSMRARATQARVDALLRATWKRKTIARADLEACVRDGEPT